MLKGIVYLPATVHSFGADKKNPVFSRTGNADIRETCALTEQVKSSRVVIKDARP